ncbi:hypothetical protein IVB12_15770 [Bradyrhizobium sp. 179]|uniref:hypothetical protein n=1 Tax=Bradyrhizobium sp. 179 TaxID=2782648 RepID=UPI001FFBA255|nr:hypothetical protein [Bradyrhizobium sp. 179]MCK1543374.1 hypothetical protein [Bradyrhizobium sp. 179]
MNPIELDIITRLIEIAREKDYTISVFDGEEYAVKRETDKAVILAAMAATEMDTLVLRDPAGVRIGSVTLIYGNDLEVISDHSDNVLTNEVVARTMMEFDRSAA